MSEYDLPTYCEQLAADIAAETDPDTKAELEALYAQGCAVGKPPVDDDQVPPAPTPSPSPTPTPTPTGG